jgi:antitoxin component HigA of HigAB toxin-antitoxin module
MSTITLPSYLESTRDLIQRTFPYGIDNDAYLPLLTLLEPELSDRNLAIVIASLTNKEYSQVLNDIYHVKSHPLNNPEQIEVVRSLLDENGLTTWLEQA